MDDLFRKRLQNFEAQPPTNGFKPIHKTLLRRKWMKYLSIGSSTLAVVAVISGVVFWQKSTNENFAVDKTMIEKKENQLQKKSLNNSPEKLIYSSEIQDKNSSNLSENESGILTKSGTNSKGNNLALGTHSTPKNATQNHKKVSPKNTLTPKVKKDKSQTVNQNLVSAKPEKFSQNTGEKTLVINKNTFQSSTQGNDISLSNTINKSKFKTENPQETFKPIPTKKPIFSNLEFDLKIDSSRINLKPFIRIPRRNLKFQYTFYLASEWRSGNYAPYQKIEDYYASVPPTKDHDDDHKEEEEKLSILSIAPPVEASSPEHYFEQKMTDFGIRAEQYFHKRIAVYWTISMTQLQETYQEKYTKIDYPVFYYFDDLNDNFAGTNSLPDSLNSWGQMLIPTVYESTEKTENQFTYIGISQGFAYDIFQKKSRNLRLNLEIGASGMLSGNSTYFIDGFEIDYQDTNFSSFMLHWRTGLEFRQRLSENWDIIGGAQFRGLWNDESAGGILQGVQIGLRWR